MFERTGNVCLEIKMPQVLNEKEGGIQLSVPDMCSVDSEAWTAESEF